MTPLIQKEDEKLHGMWRGESRWIMNYKCITNEPSRGLRTARPAQSISPLTRQWAACCCYKEKESQAANSHTHTLRHVHIRVSPLEKIVSLLSTKPDFSFGASSRNIFVSS